MFHTNRKKFLQLLLLISLSCLSSCAAESFSVCPAWPLAGPAVADELTAVEGKNFWEWMGRIDKLRQQLELCQ